MVEAIRTGEAVRSRIEGTVSQASYTRSRSDILYRSGTGMVKRPKKKNGRVNNET